MESGHRSGTAAGEGGGVAEAAGGGLLCHACGYQYPNAHPSAKQRRAHRKNCGKPPSSPAAAAAAAAAAGEEEGAGERDGKGLLLQGEGGGEGIGAGAAECAGGLPGSAPEAGDAAEDGGNAGRQELSRFKHSSRDGTEIRSSVDGRAEVTPEASKSDNDDTLAKVSTQYSEKGLPLLDENTSDLAVGSEQLQDVSTSFVPAQPEDGGARSGSAFSVHEIEDSSVVSQVSNATGDEISEQTDDAVSQPIGTAVTEVDDMTNTIGKHIPSEDKSIIGGESDFSRQEILQTKIGEGHSTTSVEEDPSDKNLSVVDCDEFPKNDTKYDQPNTNDLGGCQSQDSDNVKIQQQLDITSVTADHVAIPKQVGIVEQKDYANTAGGIQAISSASGPAVAAEVISVGDADSIATNICSSDITIEDSTLKNVTSGTVEPSQVNLVDLSTCSTTHEVNMISSTNNAEEMRQNEQIASNLATPETNEVHVIGNLEEKQQDEEIRADSVSHETNVACSTDNSSKISAAQSASLIEEKEQIDQVVADLGSEKINVTSSRDIFEQTKQSADTKTKHGIDVACGIETTEGKIAACEINVQNATDTVEDKEQVEEITTGPISHGMNMICSTVNEDSMHTEGIAEQHSSHETVMVHSTDNVEETKYEETMADPTSHIIGVVTGGVEDKEEEMTQDPTSDRMNVAPSANNLEENKTKDPILDPTICRSFAESTTDVEEKRQDKETTTDPGSGGNSTIQSTADASKGMKNADATTDPVPDENNVAVPDENNVAQSTDDAGERGQKEESAAKEITTIQTTDQSEEIADKEMVTDSEKNHVSLKHLLADKTVETKEKKASTKDRVLSFKRRASKDNVSPVKPGSPKAGSGQQDWNSPARLPTEKKPKGRKQQWVPFICCPSIH
ncbi:hypothetical protein ACP4OV_005426 [Aristida adscensionis]